MNSGGPYNPLDKQNLANSVAQALLKKSVRPLADTEAVGGAGVYAIYHVGDYPAYESVSRSNRNGMFKQPIYVGKAIPRGGRKGGLGADASKGRALRDRLRQHSTSIDQALNLDLNDFFFRSLIVDDIWIPLGENVLIEAFSPVWNMIVDGFGNKDPGRRRREQYRSSWDILHPGREFAKKLAVGPVTEAELLERVDAFLKGRLAPTEPVDNGN